MTVVTAAMGLKYWIFDSFSPRLMSRCPCPPSKLLLTMKMPPKVTPGGLIYLGLLNTA